MIFIILLIFNLNANYEFKNVKYVKNYDGDTITFNIDGVHPFFGNNIRVRLARIDAPEINSKNKEEKLKALITKKYVSNVLSNAKKIELKDTKRCKYFRIIADVIVDGKSLSDDLLEKQLAVKYN